MRKINKINARQMESERKGCLELLLIVLISGFILNFLVTALFELFNGTGSIWIVIISILILVIAILLYTFFGIIKPSKVENVIPIVIFFDEKQETIAIPVEIHAPQQPVHGYKYYDISIRTPFASQCRVVFDEYKKLVEGKNLPENSIELSTILVELIQYIFLLQYSNSHIGTWNPFEDYVIGPFQYGFGFGLPETKIDLNLMDYESNNRFVSKQEIPMIFPNKTKAKLYSDNFITLDGPLFTGKINIHKGGIKNLDMMNLEYGVFSSWNRELSSDFNNTTAFLFYLKMNFEVKISFRRFFAEDWLPTKLRPKITIENITNWINNWVETASLFFDWVDEDLNELPDIEKDKLIDKESTIYRKATFGLTPQIRIANRKSIGCLRLKTKRKKSLSASRKRV